MTTDKGKKFETSLAKFFLLFGGKEEPDLIRKTVSSDKTKKLREIDCCYYFNEIKNSNYNKPYLEINGVSPLLQNIFIWTI